MRSRARGGQAERGSATVLAVGADIPVAAAVIRYEGDDDPAVARYAEVLVPELLAATWWRGQLPAD